MIYHLTTLPELQLGITEQSYCPRRYTNDGFVHCAATPEIVLAVARDYFAATTDAVIVLRIDVRRLTAPLIYEAAAPIAGGGTAHLHSAESWPHIYGPINLGAIQDFGTLTRRGNDFAWPVTFTPRSSDLGEPRG